jgi:hypothetical protein
LLAGITVDLEPVEEGSDDFRIELGARATAYFGHGILERASILVSLVVDHNVESLSHSHDLRSQRNFAPLEPLGIAGPIKPFVVHQYDLSGGLRLEPSGWVAK